MDDSGYLSLFGPAGAGLDDRAWLARANATLTPCLAALNARFESGSRAEKALIVSYEPGAAARNFGGMSGGAIAEMLDQAATHCGSFVTSFACPTISMTVNILRPGTAGRFFAHARVIKITSVAAVLGADLKDDVGKDIASISVISQFIKEISA